SKRQRLTMWIKIIALLCFEAAAQIVYTITEESSPGTNVGNLAKDLHLDVNELEARGFQISGPNTRYFEVNVKTGVLLVKDRIDREELCSRNVKCSLEVEAIVSSPLNLYRFEVTILDVNDNAPSFRIPEVVLNVSELAFPGEKFALPNAFDADVGSYSVKSYKLSQNEHFTLDVQNVGEPTMSAEMALHKTLDREKQAVIKLTLTATDGGKPPKSGTLYITVNVQDVNDNIPEFDKPLYKATVVENTPRGASVISVHARDLDEGLNGEIQYSFINQDNDNDVDKFAINPITGEITVNGELDHEKHSAVEIRVQVKDKGQNPRASHCKVLIEITDVNDNPPEITVTSLANMVREDAPLDTMVGLLTVKDYDADKNGIVQVRVLDSVPFKIKNTYKNHYSLVVDGTLDRERASQYNLTIMATDEGLPPLSSTSVITVHVSDVNDNAPRFTDPVINIFVKENGPVGAVIYSMSADDPDVDENAKVTFQVINNNKHNVIGSVINVNSETGDIISLQSFNYEELKTFHFKVQATDSGVPPLSSNVTVNVFILDENDNNPTILAPYSEHGSVNSENIPYSAEAGYFVAKIRAVDNAWLLYSLEQTNTDVDLFKVHEYTGEIRTTRRVIEDNSTSFILTVLVRDNGLPPLSSTATIYVHVLESPPKLAPETKRIIRADSGLKLSSVTIYLIIALSATTFVFLVTIFVLAIVRCHAYCTQPGSCCPCCVSKKNVPEGGATAAGDGIGFHLYLRLNFSHSLLQPKAPNSDWRYSASLRAGGVISVHMEESSVMQGAQGVLVQNWPTASSAADGEGGEVSPPMGAGVDSNSWHFRYGPGGPGAPPQHLKPGEVPPEAFIIPGSPAIISIRQNQGGEDDKSDFITFGKKEEAKKKKKKKKEKKDKKDKGKDDGDE
uniref:Protocadherin 2 alpha c n=1 Tax=Neolamprologus brichardi TaxID=32507 RepID=A0A3Q4MG38_NEOBR